MKKWLFLLIYSLGPLFGLPMQDHRIDLSALADLAQVLGLSKDADLVSETQKHWLRSPSQERWEVAELPTQQRNFVLHWAETQGLFASWKPSSNTYDKALILGGITGRMQKRLGYLAQLWNEGTRFHEVVWLTGDRPLDPRVDQLMDRCSNESEAAQILWDEAIIPEQMRSLPVVFVAAPMKAQGASLKRPNTADTIMAWCERFPEPCKALFVSSQPFCGYQFAVIKGALPESFLFDCVGDGIDPLTDPNIAAITLDSLARWIYQENLIR